MIKDYGEASETVTDNCGIKIPLGQCGAAHRPFKDKLEQLASDSEFRERLGTAARARALDLFTWDGKARMFVEIYRWVLGRRPDKSDFRLVVSEGAGHVA